MSIGRMFRVSCLLGYRRVARAEEKDKKKCNQRLNEVEIARDTGNTAGHTSVRTMFPYSHYFARLGRGVKSSSRYTSRCCSVPLVTKSAGDGRMFTKFEKGV